jgi:hypothetical protein
MVLSILCDRWGVTVSKLMERGIELSVFMATTTAMTMHVMYWWNCDNLR